MKHFTRPGFLDLELDFGISPRPPQEFVRFLLKHDYNISEPSEELVDLLYKERYKALYGCYPMQQSM